MPITTQGLTVIAANMTGSALPKFTAIGTSGLTFVSGQTILGSETDRNQIISNDLSVAEEVTFTSNFSPAEMSGTVLREFATMTTGSSMLNREVLVGSSVFDGEQELQIQQTFKLFR